jgi:probable F420-dependent oxidoreductase
VTARVGVPVGILTPIVSVVPRNHGVWEHGAGLRELVAIAESADALGFHHLTCSEHVAVPPQVAAERGGTYWDPLPTLGYLAARTARIRLATHVLVLGYHHPLAIAKRYGTLDVVSGGRLVLGVGVGTLEQEFELLGAPFTDRGARADEAIAALRATLSTETPSWHGVYFGYEDMIVRPCAIQERVPIWVGGKTRRSLRRALEQGDAWVPVKLHPPQLADALARARDTESWQQRGAELDIVLAPEYEIDPLNEPERTADVLGNLVDAGATMLNVHLLGTSLEHYLDELAAMADLAGLPAELPSIPLVGKPSL